MTDTSSEDLLKLVLDMGPKMDFASVIVLASRIERTLEFVIEGHMPLMSNKSKRTLFEGYGPLSSFSAKIDVAKASGYITMSQAKVLDTIRAIRNKFAHAEEDLHLDHPVIAPLAAKLPDAAKTNNQCRFLRSIRGVECRIGDQA